MKFLKNYTQFNESNQIDTILDKISKHGMDSLTAKERFILDNPDNKEKEFDIDLDGEMVSYGEKISKKEPLSKWSKDAEYDILEYLHKNFYRIFSDDYVAEDNIGRKLTIEQVISRVQTYFNSTLGEIGELVSKWSTGMLSEKFRGLK